MQNKCNTKIGFNNKVLSSRKHALDKHLSLFTMLKSTKVLPNSSNLISFAAWIPSSFKFFSICLLRALEALSSADIAQPMMKLGVHEVKVEEEVVPPQMGINLRLQIITLRIAVGYLVLKMYMYLEINTDVGIQEFFATQILREINYGD